MVLVIVIETTIYKIIDYDYEHRCAEHEHDSPMQVCYLKFHQAKKEMKYAGQNEG